AGRTAPATAAPAPVPARGACLIRGGQEVRYKQGRGTFAAKVKAVDEKAKTLTLERVSDGTKVVRPFDKVTPA
ncbi:PspA, partial [Myxococcus sp. 1LA]